MNSKRKSKKIKNKLNFLKKKSFNKMIMIITVNLLIINNCLKKIVNCCNKSNYFKTK